MVHIIFWKHFLPLHLWCYLLRFSIYLWPFYLVFLTGFCLVPIPTALVLLRALLLVNINISCIFSYIAMFSSILSLLIIPNFFLIASSLLSFLPLSQLLTRYHYLDAFEIHLHQSVQCQTHHFFVLNVVLPHMFSCSNVHCQCPPNCPSLIPALSHSCSLPPWSYTVPFILVPIPLPNILLPFYSHYLDILKIFFTLVPLLSLGSS
jgi:hypothetical protein